MIAFTLHICEGKAEAVRPRGILNPQGNANQARERSPREAVMMILSHNYSIIQFKSILAEVNKSILDYYIVEILFEDSIELYCFCLIVIEFYEWNNILRFAY